MCTGRACWKYKGDRRDLEATQGFALGEKERCFREESWRWHDTRAEMDMQRAQHRGAGCRLELGEMLPAVGGVATLLPS